MFGLAYLEALSVRRNAIALLPPEISLLRRMKRLDVESNLLRALPLELCLCPLQVRMSVVYARACLPCRPALCVCLMCLPVPAAGAHVCLLCLSCMPTLYACLMSLPVPAAGARHGPE